MKNPNCVASKEGFCNTNIKLSDKFPPPIATLANYKLHRTDIQGTEIWSIIM